MFSKLSEVWDSGHTKLLLYVLGVRGLSYERSLTVSINNNGSIKTTKVQRVTATPRWNELFLFPDLNPTNTILVQLNDSENSRTPTVMAQSVLDFSEIPTDRPITKWFALQSNSGDNISIQLRILKSTSTEHKTSIPDDEIVSYKQHIESFKTGDLIAFSGIGFVPALSMMFSDAPISRLGIIVKIENKWTKVKDLYIAEFTRNGGEGALRDALTGDIKSGLIIFSCIERLHQFNGSSIFWCPLKKALSATDELKLISFVLTKREKDIGEILGSYNSPLIQWAKKTLGDAIAGPQNTEFVDLISTSFIRECLWHCAALPPAQQQITPRSPMEVVRYDCFNRPIPLRMCGAAGKQLLQQRKSSPKQSPRPVLKRASGSRSLLSPDFSTAKVERYEKLGSGGFGSVYRCGLEGFTCAIKVLPITNNTKKIDIDAVRTEVAVLERARHPNIVHYLGYDFSQTELILFMEFCPFSLQGILTKKMENPNCVRENNPREVHKFALEIVKGIAFLHNSSPPIIHRDIKTGNVLVAKDSAGNVSAVKLCDFGVAKICESNISSAKTFVGTPGLMAPEIRMGNQQYTEKVDIWSFGILLYEMSTFSSPQLPNIWVPDGIHPEFTPLLNLVCSCLVEEPLQRPTAKQLVECLALMFT